MSVSVNGSSEVFRGRGCFIVFVFALEAGFAESALA